MNVFILTLLLIMMPQSILAADFRKASWGMSRQDVIKSEHLKPVLNVADKIGYTGEIAGIKAMILYSFKDGKLTLGAYSFYQKRLSNGLYIDDYNTIESLLARKYGQPEIIDQWQSDIYKNDPSRHGTALWLGQVRKQSRYTKSGNIIGHVLYNDNGEITHLITYTSSKSAKEARQSRTKAALGQL